MAELAGFAARHDTDVFSIGFCHEHALILYVYLSNDDMESVLTVRLLRLQ